VQYTTGNGIWHWAGDGTRILSGAGGYSVLVTETSEDTTDVVRGIDRETGEETDVIVGTRNLWSRWTFVPVSVVSRQPFLMGAIVQPQKPAQPSAKGFPCPPSVAEIFTGPDREKVEKVLTAAQDLFPKTGREEGGWIYMNRKGRLTARLNDRSGQNVSGLGMAIDLNNPPIVRGSIVVATFHTHDFGMDPSMPTGEKLSIPNDLWTNEEQGVPGIIVGAGDVKGFNGYGPKRGYWRQPLPKRCDK
jgi:hypothetical protein